MTSSSTQRFKIVLGLLLGMAIGGLCRLINIPLPAPPMLPGALLVGAMTLGYVLTDRWLTKRKARHHHLCGGPDGTLKNVP